MSTALQQDAFHARRITGTLGAEVTGIDLKQPLDPGQRAATLELLFEHLVLVFPGQHLDDEQQRTLALGFGSPYIHPISRLLGRQKTQVERIIDSAESHPYQDRWHTDVSFDHAPPVIGTLRAIDIPVCGGDTLWASTRDAYDALPEDLKWRVEGLTAIHDSGAGEAFTEKSGREITEKLQSAFPGTEHPVVGTHPVTGRRHLYVNRQFTRRIAGLPPEESQRLLEDLYRYVENPNLQMRHPWSVGDVGIWDERATWHFAAADHYPQRREMGRIIVGAEAA